MKKVIFSLCFLFFTNLTFAKELWNGFTTEMSKEDVIAHAREMLSVSERAEIDNSSLPIKIDADGHAYPGIWRSSEIERIIMRSPQQAYDRGWLGNIIAYIHRGKLFAIWVRWAAEENDVFNRAKGQFGNPKKSLVEPQGHKTYYWSLNDKDFIVYDGGFIYVDRSAQQAFLEEQKKTELENKAKSEAQQKAAVDAIKF